MRFRTKILLFVTLATLTVLILWWLPATHVIISSEGMKTVNGYWWWLVGGAFVIFGCWFEYLWITGPQRFDLRFAWPQKLTIGAILISVIIAALSYTFFQLHR